MIYFQNITELEQAKLRYRVLAKELHPDKGGSVITFQHMQEEYKIVLLNLQNKQVISTSQNNQQTNDIIVELGKLAKVLLQKQVPQQYLQQRIIKSQSLLEKGFILQIGRFSK